MAGCCGWAGRASGFEWAEGKDVWCGACEDAVGEEPGGVCGESGVGKCVHREVRGSVVEHVYVGVEGRELAMGSSLCGCEGGGVVPFGVVAAGRAGRVKGLFDGCSVVVWFGVGDMESHMASMSKRLAYECGEGPEVVV